MVGDDACCAGEVSGACRRVAILTPKQERFVQEYLIDLNATQAATRAGYSAKTAYSIGQRLLKDVEVAKAVARGQEKVAAKIGLTLDAHLEELAKLRDAARQDSAYAPAVSAEVARGKAVGLYTERVEHTGEGGGPIAMTVRFVK